MYSKYLWCIVLLFPCGSHSADPTASVAAIDASANEAAGNTGTFRITFSAANSSATTVKYSVASGTAINGTDYANLPSTVVMPANTTTVDILVTPVEDVLYEGSQTVVLTLIDDVGYSLAAPISATINIEDNEVQALVLTQTVLTLKEGHTTTVGVRLAFKPEAGETEVNINRINSEEASYVPNHLNFTPINWSTNQTVSILASYDLSETSEEVILQLSGSVFATRDITITIHDLMSVDKSSVLARPDPLDTDTSRSIPGRIHLSATPGAGVPILKAQGSNRIDLVARTGGDVFVIGAPNSLVTFFVLDEGFFKENYASSVTVQADGTGLAKAKFLPPRIGSKSVILVSSPAASGHVRLVVKGTIP